MEKMAAGRAISRFVSPLLLPHAIKGAIAQKKGLQRLCQRLNKSPVTVKGYVAAVPQDERQAKVAVVQDDMEYRVMPRGAGVDLAGEVSVPVEVTGLVEEADGVFYLTVRGYKVLEDDSWLEE